MSLSAFSQLAFLLYNDQPPKSSSAPDSSSRGHTKGEAWTGGRGATLNFL